MPALWKELWLLIKLQATWKNSYGREATYMPALWKELWLLIALQATWTNSHGRALSCMHAGIVIISALACRLSHCKQHERTHPWEKPHTCKDCKHWWLYPVIILEGRKEHKRTRTGEKSYVFKHYDKCFSDPPACKQHERAHTGEKQYACKHCKKCFN